MDFLFFVAVSNSSVLILLLCGIVAVAAAVVAVVAHLEVMFGISSSSEASAITSSIKASREAMPKASCSFGRFSFSI